MTDPEWVLCGVYNPRGPGVKVYASRDISEPRIRDEVRASFPYDGVPEVSGGSTFSAIFKTYEIVEAPTFGEAVAILMKRWSERDLPEGAGE